MSSVDIRALDGETTGSIELPDAIFDAQASIPLLHQVVTAQLAAARQGTHKAKRRGEVAGGGRKPYKQKGTGRARQGSIRAPQFTGGGVVHGPLPRDYTQRINKKMKAAALRGALSDRAREGRIHVVEAFVEVGSPKTRHALKVLRGITEARRVLVVLPRDDDSNWLSLRNEPSVHLLVADQLNTYDVLLSDEIVFTTAALQQFLGEPVESPAATDEVDQTDEADEVDGEAVTGEAVTAEAATDEVDDETEED